MSDSTFTRIRRPVARRRGRVFLCALLWVAGLPMQAGCERSGLTRNSRADRGADLNVLLISIDTTRADCLACYGHPEIKTPNIDRIAAEGTLFTQCTTPVPITLPAHTSLMTGTYPFSHGVRDNGQFQVQAGNLTLAEVLRDADHTTGAQIGAYVLNREFGLDQGFDTYADVLAARRPAGEREARAINERSAEEVCAGASAWLQENADRKFFLFVHFFDPHQGYLPPPRFAAQYENPYLGEIAYVDEQIGGLLRVLDELDLTRRTLLILTSDHGEGLGEHGEETHANFVYDTTLTVPLIFRCPGRVPANRRVAAQVRLIDIAPTVLDLLELPALPDAEGTSLLPLITGGVSDLNLAAYSETFYPRLNMGYAWYRARRHGGWKYIHGRQPGLYHVSDDPHEERNLAAVEPERVAQMRSELRMVLAESSPVVASVRQPLSSGDRRALESLGYISPTGDMPAFENELDLFEPVGPDPTDHAEDIRLMSKALDSLHASDYPQAEQMLRSLLDRSGREDTFGWAHKTLAEALRCEGKTDEAIQEYHAALQIRPDDGETYRGLGCTLAMAGRTDEAIVAYERALECPPVFAYTHHEYGLSLAEKGRRHEALEQQRAAIQLDPQFARAHAQIGKLLTLMGRPDEAAEAYERALELAPQGEQIRRQFAEFLLAQNRPAEALREYQQVVQLSPDDARVLGGLGLAHSEMGNPEEAIKYLRQAVAMEPKLPHAWHALAEVLGAECRYDEALAALRSGHKTAPRYRAMTNSLAWLLASCPIDALRDGTEALRLAQDLERATAGRDAKALDTLAAALAEQGRFSEAVEAIDRAISLAEVMGKEALVNELKQRRDLYAADTPFRLPLAP